MTFSARPTGSSTASRQVLLENELLLRAVKENMDVGRMRECVAYLKLLEERLVRLAKIRDIQLSRGRGSWAPRRKLSRPMSESQAELTVRTQLLHAASLEKMVPAPPMDATPLGAAREVVPPEEDIEEPQTHVERSRVPHARVGFRAALGHPGGRREEGRSAASAPPARFMRWTEEETARLVTAVRMFGAQDRARLADYVGTGRTVEQVKTRINTLVKQYGDIDGVINEFQEREERRRRIRRP